MLCDLPLKGKSIPFSKLKRLDLVVTIRRSFWQLFFLIYIGSFVFVAGDLALAESRGCHFG